MKIEEIIKKSGKTYEEIQREAQISKSSYTESEKGRANQQQA